MRIKWRFPTPLRETIEINLGHLVSNVLSHADPAMPRPETPTNPRRSTRTTAGKFTWVPYRVFRGMTPQAKAAAKQRALQFLGQGEAPLHRPKGKGKGKQKGKAPWNRK